MLTARNKLASAEDNGVVIHNPLALTHTFQPCRPAYPEAWRQYRRVTERQTDGRTDILPAALVGARHNIAW